MTACTEKQHPNHSHQHGPNCGHTAVRHDGMTAICTMCTEITSTSTSSRSTSANPAQCTPQTRCPGHTHGPACGHEAIPHGDHVDYLVNGRLHRPHGDHCDDHGAVQLA
jgi:hypothetical protein